MKILDKCEICSEKNFEELFKGRDKLLGVPGEFSLVKCKNCGVIFLNPQPEYKELQKHYSNEDYYSLKKIDVNSRKLKMKLILYDVFFNPDKKNYLKRILFSFFKHLVRGTQIKKDKKLLDIGCGSGQFLYEMKEVGFKEVCGIEPGEFDEKSSEKFKLNIQKGKLEKTNFKENYFDIITMNHVLEHVNNPTKTLKEIYRILKKEGIFIVAVPNTRSLSKKIFNRNWLAYDVPRHLFNYSDKILTNFLKKNKFEIIKKRYNSRPNQFVVSLYFALGVKNREGVFNKFLELLFLPLTWAVNLLKMGDQIEVWCSKKI